MWDLTNVQANNYEVLPDGEYLVVAKAGEMHTTKKGDGMYVKVEFEVLEGPKKGRKLFQNFNVQNANPKAVEIALAQMKSFFIAAGVKDEKHFKGLTPQSFAGQSCIVKVITETDAYGEKNIIKAFKAPTGTTEANGKTASVKQVARATF